MKPTIAIIGAGTTGTELATRLARKSYRLLLFDRDLDRAKRLVEQLCRVTPSADAESINCQVNACWEADIIVLAVPESAKKDLADRIRQVAICKIVVSLSTVSTNSEDEPQNVASAHMGEELQQWLPNSKVVNVLIDERADAFLSGNHAGALNAVSELITAAGLAPVIVENWSVTSAIDDAA